jgi:Mycoplasma protein of unknown function, DUF285
MEEAAIPRPLNAVLIERHSLLPDDLWLPILAYLDVKTLIEKKEVCRIWRVNCTEAIDAKQTATSRKSFSTNHELCQAVKKYCGYNQATFSYSPCDPLDAEQIAVTYGYPINKWDVSNVQDFSFVLSGADTFNEDISLWNVSHATTMKGMFCNAKAFNQDLSFWNVSNVRDMSMMFWRAHVFNNESISNWDVSNVETMCEMFQFAKAFNQDLSFWNVQNVKNMSLMFDDATSFNQNLSRWNVSNVDDMECMFRDATAFDQDVESWGLWDSSKLADSDTLQQ